MIVNALADKMTYEDLPDDVNRKLTLEEAYARKRRRVSR
jgi:hypothetical protein